MRVTLTLLERIEGTLGSSTVIDITEDIIDGNYPEFSRYMTEDTLFAIEAGEITLRLRNNQNKYASQYSTPTYPIKGCQINDQGRHAQNWRMERVTIREEGSLRYLGYIFTDQSPITYNPDDDTVSFSIYDPTYLLKLYKLSKAAHTYSGADAVKYRERFVLDVPLSNDPENAESKQNVLHVLDKTGFDALPREEQIRWEKVYLFDTYGGLAREHSNGSYEAIDVSTLSVLVPEGITAYRRRAAAVPSSMNIYTDLLVWLVREFNYWSPFFLIQLASATTDIEYLTHDIFVKIDFPEPFNKLEIYAPTGTGRIFGISFKNNGVSDDGSLQQLNVIEFINKVGVHEMLNVSFPAFPPLPSGGLRVTLDPSEVLGDRVSWVVSLNNWVITHQGGVIRDPTNDNILYVWRMSKRVTPIDNAVFGDLTPGDITYSLAHYCWQYYCINLSDNSISDLVVGEERHAYVIVLIPVSVEGGAFFQWINVEVADPIHNPDWDRYGQIRNLVGDAITLEEGNPINYFDSSQDPSWPFASDRYYSPFTSGPGVFYLGTSTINSVALDYRNKTAGDLLVDLAKLTNSLFYLQNNNESNLSLVFANRDYGVNTLTLSSNGLVNITQEDTNLLGEPLVSVSSQIIENDAFNKALAEFYSLFFKKTFRRYTIEMERNSSLRNNDFDVMWELQIDSNSYGIIQKYTLKEMSVVFETLRSVPNFAIERNLRGT